MSSRPIRRPRRRPVAGRRAILKTGGGGGPSIADWALNGSAIDYDFINNLFAVNRYPAGLATAQLSVSNNGGYVQSVATGLWTSVGSNTARRSDKGVLCEEARTNSLLQCRDMTNAAWVKGATATVAQTQVGIDGGANSATLVTGGAVTATNTVLQTITLGSAADTYSVWLKRVTGSGTIEISADGSTWTGVTLTTSYQQFQVQQTLANPVCGIRITTNGDQLAADFSQLETGAFATSPILTTVAAATRNVDLVQVTGTGATLIPLSASAFFQTFGNEGISALAIILSVGADNLSATISTAVRAADGTNTISATLGSGSNGGTAKSAYGLDNTSMTVVANGGTLGTQATSTWATQAAGQTPYFGNRSAGDFSFNGYIQRAVFALPKGVFNGVTA